ncbi:hypothetical protein ACVRXS_01855 [Streptococcus orisratti]|uniref:hypothetical protein n=1 Tax=Streptococcus orisratti TaxID=114652 RepID=UPI00035D0C6C|nr:hypothetical protein [Streptococcus orisratti]
MVRENYFEHLDNMKFDAKVEYNRLRELVKLADNGDYSFIDIFSHSDLFIKYPNRNGFISYADIITYFENRYISGSDELLFIFSEFIIDFLNYLDIFNSELLSEYLPVNEESYTALEGIEIGIRKNVSRFLDLSNHELVKLENGRQIIVEKNVYASQVSQIISETNIQEAMKVLEYDHFENKGNIQRKQEILISLASYLEPLRAELNSSEELKEVLKVNNKKIIAVEKLFEMFNQFGLRHNNNKQYHADLTDEELEQWYDDIYTSTLFVILSLDEARILPKLAQARVDWAEQKKQIE